MKIFNSSYRNDQKQIARVTNDGKVPKNVLNDLIDARKVKKLQTQIEESAETVRTLLGHLLPQVQNRFQRRRKSLRTNCGNPKAVLGNANPRKLSSN